MPARTWRTVASLVVATFVAGAPAVVRAGDAPPVAAPKPSADAPADDRTDVVLKTDARIREGRNVLWCATGQLAWDALADAIGTDGRLDLVGAKDPDVVDGLNRRTFPHDAIDGASVAVAAGRVRDGVLDRIREAWRKLHPDGAGAPVLVAGPEEAVAFAALRKQILFARPFRVLPDPITFDGGTRPLTAFGMIHDDHGPDVEAMVKQVRVFLPADSSSRAHGGAGVVELLPQERADRILLSNLPPETTLEATWNAAWACVGVREGVTLAHAEDLVIPRIRLDVRRGFPELVGAHLRGQPDHRLRVAQQEVVFALTERGATVESATVLIVTAGIGMRMEFDRPFLLALLRRGATRPYLLAWIGNDTWLESVAPAERLDPRELEAIGGRWVLDREASARAEAVATLQLNGPGPYPDPIHPDRTITQDEAVARETARVLARRAEDVATVTIDQEGWLTLDHGGSAYRMLVARIEGRRVLLQVPQSDDDLPTVPSLSRPTDRTLALEWLLIHGTRVALHLEAGRLEIPQGALVFRRP